MKRFLQRINPFPIIIAWVMQKFVRFDEGGFVENTPEKLKGLADLGQIGEARQLMGLHSDLYKCNHHHPMTKDQSLVEFGTGMFVADKRLIPLLKALNEAGLITRTHNHSPEGTAFLSIVLDDQMSWEVRKVTEPVSNRDTFRGKTELLIAWQSDKLKED